MKTKIILSLIISLSSFMGITQYEYSGDRQNAPWTEDEIELVETEFNKIYSDIEGSLGKDTKSYCDCELAKLMENYPDFKTADKDQEGCTAFAEKCIAELREEAFVYYKYSGDRQKAAWSEEDIEIAESELNLVYKEIEAALEEFTTAYCDCYIDKLMENYPDFETADGDEPGCSALAKQCVNEIYAEEPIDSEE